MAEFFRYSVSFATGDSSPRTTSHDADGWAESDRTATTRTPGRRKRSRVIGSDIETRVCEPSMYAEGSVKRYAAMPA